MLSKRVKVVGCVVFLLLAMAVLSSVIFYKYLLFSIKQNNREIFESEKSLKKWPHSYNNLKKFCENQKKYDGFEIDLQFDDSDKKIYVEHDFNNDHNKNNEFSHYLKCFNSNGMWLDLKNFETLESFDILEEYLSVLPTSKRKNVYLERKFRVLKKLKILDKKENLMSVFNLKCNIIDLPKIYHINKNKIKTIIIKEVSRCKDTDILKYFNVFYFRYRDNGGGLTNIQEITGRENDIKVALFDAIE